uniref:Putative ovule protein n=1 Tax=Solanum chacoense TaxID=4108 RepID=A0A0V0GJF5_SOLCH
MHSKPKKVIHSLKDSLLRIALVHPSVSKIVDIERPVRMTCFARILLLLCCRYCPVSLGFIKGLVRLCYTS